MACSWPWPWPPSGGSGADEPPAQPSAPIVLVPGICGTMLGVRAVGEAGDGTRCWVSLRSADASFQKLWGKYNSKSGRVELLAPGQEVCVPQGQDESGLYPVSVLDPDYGFASASLHYFEPLITFLQKNGYSPGVNLFGAGYDFRQSCRVSGRALLARLKELSRRCGGRRLDLVTHSMGGLVVRSLLADFPAEFEALVGRWIAVGCPFGGAPGYAVDALLTGVQFGGSLGDYYFVERSTFLQAACQSPAIFELLPPADFPYAKLPPQLTLWLKQPIPPPDGCGVMAAAAGLEADVPEGGMGTDGAQLPLRCVEHQQFVVQPDAAAAAAAASAAVAEGPTPGSSCAAAHRSLAAASSSSGSSSSSTEQNGSCSGKNRSSTAAAPGTSGGLQSAEQYVFDHAHLPGLLACLLKDNSVQVDGTPVPLPFQQELWALAQASHDAWSSARLPPGCLFYNLHGAGISTPYDVQYGSWWLPLTNLPAVSHANASFTYIDGDGTVPTESATAHGLEPAASVALKADHRGLVASQAVFTQVLQWLQDPLPLGQPSGSGGSGQANSHAGAQPVLLPVQQCADMTAQDTDSLAEPLLAARRQQKAREESGPCCCALRWPALRL